MEIDYRALRSITAREIISALVRDGFLLDRQSGSHQLYKHLDGRRVTVTLHHPGQTCGFLRLRTGITAVRLNVE
jgi:predicted RNA binding protein YcfA (HicA-like mRNA interferase family)